MNNINVEEIFASNVFTMGVMKERLPEDVLGRVKKVMEQDFSWTESAKKYEELYNSLIN